MASRCRKSDPENKQRLSFNLKHAILRRSRRISLNIQNHKEDPSLPIGFVQDYRTAATQLQNDTSNTLFCYLSIIFLLTFSFLLTSCGLRAVYSDKYVQLPTNNPLGAVEIAPIESIEGAEFCHHLSNLLPKTHTARYLLKVQFGNSSIPGAFQKNSDIIRAIINQEVKYQLFDLSTNKLLTSGNFKQITSYNTIFAPYSAHIESEKALEDLTKNAASELFRRLALYFQV